MSDELAQVSLRPEALLADARRRAGPASPSVETPPGLDVLTRALEREAHLSPDGRRAVRDGLVSALLACHRIAAASSRRPEVAERPIERPVFVIGLLRTGSTLLHNLLAHHPDLRTPLLWELINPVSPPEATSTAELERLGEAYVGEYYRVAPSLRTVHPLDARRPDECHRLTANAFHSMVFTVRFEVPSYAAWLREQDARDAYRFHREQLGHILDRCPGGTVVMKCPFHIWDLDALLAAYPDARFVHLHRDPAKVVPSTCSLCAVVRAARADWIDPVAIGRQWLGEIERALERLRGYRKRRVLDPARTLDVSYTDLARDPLATVAEICDFIGVPLTDRAAAAMRAHLDENPRDKHGPHRYSAEAFGLDARDLSERFSDYRAAYDVPTGV